MAVITILVITTLMICDVSADYLKIHNNRYDDLVIAISPTIKENRALIDQLKNMTRDASVFLYEATRHRAYFGNVKILVPENWSPDQSWSQATVETFEEANIRVDKPHPSHSSDPYTFQPEGCGVRGRYIHLTEEYVLDKEGSRAQTWGPPGRTIVHEFAHLRYGVFDEYGLGTDDYPNFYLDDNVAYPTACTYSIRGQPQGNCTVNQATNLPLDPNCYFLGDLKQNSAKVSIMYDPAIETMTTFCETNGNDPDMIHNILAPNQQNKICNFKGTWDIIKDNVDFKGVNPPLTKTKPELMPTFTVLQRVKKTTTAGAEVCGRPVVLVLDVSGSMQGERIFKQAQTAIKLIKDILPDGTKVGVVTFSTNPTVAVQLTTLSTIADRNRVAAGVPMSAYGSTGIGGGLLKAKQMLEDAGVQKEGRIVLITDGEETDSPYVADVINQIATSGIRVHAVAYSSAAAQSILQLTQRTGGQYAYYSEAATSTVLDSVIERLMKDISTCDHITRIEITRLSKILKPSQEVGGEVIIDATLTRNTMFVFTLPQRGSVTITLKAPDGHTYTASSPEYSIDKNLNIVRFNFKEAKIGRWHFTLSSSSSGVVSVVAKALPDTNTNDPYEANSWLSSTAANLDESNGATIVYVYVHKGYSPLIHADVTVTVERPAGQPVTLKLRDNGVIPDNLANDGVYSSYFTQYSGNQRYSLDVDVRSIPGKTSYIVQESPTYGGAVRRDRENIQPVKQKLTGNFSRSSSAGAMDVTGYVPNKDIFPPSRVTDVRVVAFDTESSTVTLTWTAPGNDLDKGTAKNYELRISQSLNELANKFDECQIVSPAMLVSGSLQPQTAGANEHIVIKTPGHWSTIFFALRTHDDAGHISDMSNMVTATFKQVTLSGQTTQLPEATAVPVKDDGPDVGVIIAIVGGLIGAAGIIGVVIVVVNRTKKGQNKVSLPENPLESAMTEPSVPATTVVIDF